MRTVTLRVFVVGSENRMYTIETDRPEQVIAGAAAAGYLKFDLDTKAQIEGVEVAQTWRIVLPWDQIRVCEWRKPAAERTRPGPVPKAKPKARAKR